MNSTRYVTVQDARLILTAPEPALAECLIPPSATLLYEERGRGSSEAEPSAASWDPGAARPGVRATSPATRYLLLCSAVPKCLLCSTQVPASGHESVCCGVE